MPAIAFSRTIGPVPLDVILSENHTSEIEITGEPIETGAEVNDHAYIKPKKVVLEIGDSNTVATWQALKRFQESRVPFILVTGLDVYKNMLIKTIDVTRDKQFSTVLKGRVELQEVIIVDTAYASAEEDTSANPSGTGKPGGAKSNKAAKLSPSRSSNSVTADKASGTVQRGDAPSVTSPTTGNSAPAIKNRSILSSVFGS